MNMSPTRHLRILAIDDVAEDLDILKWHLARIPNYNIEFVRAGSCFEADREISENRFDVVFLDYWVGLESGIRFLSQMRSAGDNRPVIVLTGNGDERIAMECVRSGADDYLSKSDLDSETLCRAIEGAVRGFRIKQEKALLAEELRQAQRMEAIGTLAGGLAHDFNNMLATMVGFLELAMARTEGTETGADLHQVHGTCKDMAKVIERLLSFSRCRPSIKKIEDLREIVSQVETILRHTLPEEIVICLNGNSEEELLFLGNANQIQQVLLNLAMNAAEAMPKGGLLSMDISRIEVREETISANTVVPKGHYHRILVQDSGIGIIHDHLDRLFDPFYTTKSLDHIKGRGLGLAVAWQHVKDNGGHIQIESSLSKGTLVSVYLPVALADREPAHSAPRFQFPQGQETLLVVDDEEVVLDVTCEMLKKLGYTVLKARDGSEAIEIYLENRNRISAVVLDLNMPRMGGEECMDRLLALDPDLRILVATARLVTTHQKQMIERGARDIIQKPFLFQDLAKRLRATLDEAKPKERFPSRSLTN